MPPTTRLDRNSAARLLEEILADSIDDLVQPNCRGVDPELFFPRSQVAAVAEDAIEVCADCPMHEACLSYAMVWDVDGIWGGTTKPERDRQRRQRGQQPIPVTVAAFMGPARVPSRRAIRRAS